ncbi:hypothetical protein DRO53_00270 [Candidatus Bathyarchaeota archaeon]|nr:MAG: hypothetical protein DRO53_00270 [Candidatus Bathyarchaeota archaeon]
MQEFRFTEEERLMVRPSLVLLAYSEAALKSPKVRRRLENLLMGNVKNFLRRHGFPAGRSWKEGGRIFLKQENAEAAAPLAAKVFGVDYAAPAVKAPLKLEALGGVAVSLLQGKLKGRVRFAVRARRVGSHPYTSRDVEREVGRILLESFPGKLEVDLENPELIIYVEAREKAAYIYREVFPGFGGLPEGSQGKTLTLLEDNSDLAAAWLIMKRGVKPVIFSTDEGKISGLGGKLAEWTADGSLEAYMAELPQTWRTLRKVEEGLKQALWEKAKVMAASQLASKLKLSAVVYGVKLGEAATINLKLLRLLREGLNSLLLTPLAGLNGEALKVSEILGVRLEEKLTVDFSLEEALTLEGKVGLREAVSGDLRKVKKLTVKV